MRAGRSGRSRLLAMLSVAAGLSACSTTADVRASPHPTPRPRAATPTAPAAAVARRFLRATVAGDFADQWPLLAPLARAQWPSSAGRARMLAIKFSGPARIVGYTLGAPSRGVRWVSPEDPAQQAGGNLGFPVSVRFADPGAMRPLGIAADYRRLTLVVRPGRGSEPAEVLGEGATALDAPVITPAAVPRGTAAVPILMYHLVGPFPIRSQWTAKYDGAYGYTIEYGLTVPPSQFSAEMGFLVAHHYTAISLPHLADALLYGLRLPPDPVVITFDDGFLDEYRYAVPILLRDHLTATFFPCTGFIGAINGPQRYMTAAQLRRLVADGFWLEDHTVYDSVALWGVPAGLMRQLAGATAARIERISGEPVQFIAYSGLWPYASPTATGPGELALFQELRQLGYVGGLEDNQLNGTPWRETGADPFELPRLRAYPGESPAAFAGIVEGG